MSKLSGIAAAVVLGLCFGSSAMARDLNGGDAMADAVVPDLTTQFIVGKPRIYTAVVDSTAALVRGTAGTTSKLVSAPNAYEVDFFNAGVPINVTNCTFNATLGTISTGTALPGTATTAQRAGVTNGVWIQTFDAAGASVARSFHLTVVCP